MNKLYKLDPIPWSLILKRAAKVAQDPQQIERCGIPLETLAADLPLLAMWDPHNVEYKAAKADIKLKQAFLDTLERPLKAGQACQHNGSQYLILTWGGEPDSLLAVETMMYLYLVPAECIDLDR